jgi:hypothetical protein
LGSIAESGSFSNIQTALLVPAFLDAQAYVIGNVTINNGSIFDLEDPEEDQRRYQLANKAHATTRPYVIRQQLLFKSGARYSSRELDESERIIHSNRYIQGAKIRLVCAADRVVDIGIRTTDTWILNPIHVCRPVNPAI